MKIEFTDHKCDIKPRSSSSSLQQQNSVVFTATQDVDATYDAYEKDIAVVSFHFERPTAFAYIRLVLVRMQPFAALIKVAFWLWQFL